ncbi:TetR/AcrR family transcriptional regulator [Prauserella cavernicola]|uniref:TetR/AcrR family transcriptional regulator n=1 Tax=Prauserella cavernicola TaxID=2800127 RepID=A0A934QX13_9PSEU|nr:TetR/AcrR family transcriptional regulator [Prauserella cavernicola]MBK1788076.1 TetR/AcrR family transcriptional regulator [Prauserella cavernicola]
MQSPREPARAGRPRNTQIDAAVLDATLAVLDSAGYTRFTLEEVARRAGTTKPAIYRRWPTRQHLVLAALAWRLGNPPVPDTDCTMCDLAECLSVYVAAFDRMPPGVLGPLLADCTPEPGLREDFMTMLFTPPRAAVEQTLVRAMARGDLRADLDLGLTLDLLGSLVHYRALFGHAATSDTQIEHAVETLLQGIATDYPRLLEHSLRQQGDPEVHQLHPAQATHPQ